MVVAVLALQGAFVEHKRIMGTLGVDTVELRKKSDLNQEFDGLILPGGESTVQGKLLRELDMFQDLRDRIRKGIPVLATCSGLILLAKHIVGDERAYFQTLPVTVKRNAYGRQLGSFSMKGEMEEVGRVPMTFIRAPYIEEVGEGVRVLSKVKEKIVAVRYENQIGLAFHPELEDDVRIHRMFRDVVQKHK